MAHLLSLGTPTARRAAPATKARGLVPGSGSSRDTLFRLAASAGRALPGTRLRIMAAIVMVTPFSGSASGLHSRAGLPWAVALPLGLAVGTLVWTTVIGVALLLRHGVSERALADGVPS